MSPQLKEIIDGHQPFLDSMVEDLPTGFLKRSMLLEVNSIISLMIKFHGRQIENNLSEIGRWENLKKEIKNL